MELTVTPGETCSVQFNESQFVEMFLLQKEANNVMSDDWLKSTNDGPIKYYRASWIEFAEAFMHIGFKWWKKEHANAEEFAAAKEQAIMELVDVMHFAISDYIRSSGETLPLNVEYPENIVSFDPKSLEVVSSSWNNTHVLDVIEQAVANIILTRTVNWAWINMLAEALEVSSDKLYGMYVGKNVLNKFRTSYGQREGTYCKIWNGQEDNVYLTDYLQVSEVNGVDLTSSAIKEFLTTTYLKFRESDLLTKG